ncbi:sulfite exporter TauE/SafE family protein [Natronorarus salvus]|uniref:sulfite exporter TauE/SafE family protein n=1 Tax=Natronorarus salvus TaxID=3117733 RepID=UPI0039082C69
MTTWPSTVDHAVFVGGTTLQHADLALFFLVGLLAGAHCLGMCGPLVTTYADRIGASGRGRRGDVLTVYEVRQHTLFNLGRAASYALLGGLFALIGGVAFASVDVVGAVGDVVRGTAGVLVGGAIVASGVYYLTGRTDVTHRVPIVGSLFSRVFAALSNRIDRLANSPGIVGLGAIHGLLPCPIIYPAYLYAFALGDPLRGFLSLAVLGLGTIPTLFAYATILGSVGTARRVQLHRALGLAFVVLGYVPLQHGLMLFGIHLPHPPIPFYQPL